MLLFFYRNKIKRWAIIVLWWLYKCSGPSLKNGSMKHQRRQQQFFHPNPCLKLPQIVQILIFLGRKWKYFVIENAIKSPGSVLGSLEVCSIITGKTLLLGQRDGWCLWCLVTVHYYSVGLHSTLQMHLCWVTVHYYTVGLHTTLQMHLCWVTTLLHCRVTLYLTKHWHNFTINCCLIIFLQKILL